MSLIKCPECGKEVSNSAKNCPNCGFCLKKKKKFVISVIITIIALVSIGVFGFLITHKNITDTNYSAFGVYPWENNTYNSIYYYFSSPKRYDVIVFRYPDDEEQILVKRIIGLPGEMVEIQNGKIFINGYTKIDLSFANAVPVRDFGPYVVPENCYFVLGDDINNSKDSRYWKNTYVRKDQIIGKVNEWFSMPGEFTWHFYCMAEKSPFGVYNYTEGRYNDNINHFGVLSV